MNLIGLNDGIETIEELQIELEEIILSFPKKHQKKLYEVFQNIAESHFNAGLEHSFQEEKNFVSNFKILIEKLAAKATGSLEAIEAQYQEQFAEEPDTKLKGAMGRTMPVAPERTQIEKAVEDTLISVFFDAAFCAEDIAEKAHRREMLQNFLFDCVTGVIELGPLIDKKSGNILEEFRKTDYAELEPFFNELLQKVPQGSGAGSWGPAELGLSIIGSPVKKAEKGDLSLGDRKVELKASRDPKAGARINTPAIGSGKSGAGNYTIAWDAYTEPFGFTYNKSGRTRKVEYDRLFKKNKKEVPGISCISYTNFGPTLINKVLNPAIRANRVPVSRTRQFLTDVALSAVIAEFRPAGKKLFDPRQAMNRDRTINGEGFIAQYLHMLLTFYAETDDVEEILIINPVSGNFQVVDARDPETLQRKLESGEIVMGSTYIDFSDSQSRASPQLGTY